MADILSEADIKKIINDCIYVMGAGIASVAIDYTTICALINQKIDVKLEKKRLKSKEDLDWQDIPQRAYSKNEVDALIKAAQKVAVQQAVIKDRKRIGKWLAGTERIGEDTQDSDLYDPNVIGDGIESLIAGLSPEGK